MGWAEEGRDVQEVVKRRYFGLKTLTSSDFGNESSSLSSGLEDISGHNLPAVGGDGECQNRPR